MFKINLEHNKGFKWNKSENIYSKGYLFDKEDNLYQGENLNIYFNCKSEEDFKNKIASVNGSFAVAIEIKNKLLVAVDRLRSIPLFYSVKDNILYLSDNAYWIKEELNLEKLDKCKIAEFKLTGYTCGESTLFSEIKQIQAGEYIEVEKENEKVKLKFCNYYKHLHGNYFKENIKENDFYNQLDVISENIFKRLIKSVAGRKIVVPLSGGYDSRYIVGMLKKYNCKNVLCFTYGKKSSFEVKISKKVANELGYDWYFVEYNKNIWNEFFYATTYEYFKYANNLSSLPHIQDFFAISYLKKKKLLPKNSIIVPGSCGDLLGGSYVLSKYEIENITISLNGLKEYIFNRHFNLWDDRKRFEKYKKNILDEIESGIKEFSIKNLSDFISINEHWFTIHKVSKFVINSNRIYEYFGYEWRMPLWDNELVKFWYRVPLRYRIDKKLYDDYLFDRIFEKYNISFKKDNINSHSKEKIKQYINKYLLVKYIVNFLLRARVDVNGFYELYNKLYFTFNNKSVEKKYINPNVNHILSLWFLEKFLITEEEI